MTLINKLLRIFFDHKFDLNTSNQHSLDISVNKKKSCNLVNQFNRNPDIHMNDSLAHFSNLDMIFKLTFEYDESYYAMISTFGLFKKECLTFKEAVKKINKSQLFDISSKVMNRFKHLYAHLNVQHGHVTQDNIFFD